ncbi:MAG: hypothetical protein ACLGHO_03835, partial [Gammaproteobacteria bacterium]
MRRFLLAFCVGLSSPAVLAEPCKDPASSSSIPDIALTEVASGFKNPVHVSGDGGGRLFVVEQPGV